jgi:hypothetical protein
MPMSQFYNYCASGHYPSSCFIQNITFWRLNSVSLFRWNLLSWAEPIELLPISGHQHQSQSYFTTDGHSASLSWCQVPVWSPDQIFITVRKLPVCWCGEPSLTRGQVCRLQLLLVLAVSGPSPAGIMTILYSLRFETPPTWRARYSYLYPPRNMVAQLYSQTLGSIFVASYNSQGCGGDIRTRLNTRTQAPIQDRLYKPSRAQTVCES